MRSAAEWLDEYGVSHRNATNEVLHFICVPLIVLSLLGFLWSLPSAADQLGRDHGRSSRSRITSRSSPRLALGVALAFALMLPVVQWLGTLPWPLWASSLAIFLAAWVGQFVGHAIEGQRPSFFKDLQFLLIGPLWLVMKLYGRLGLRY